MRARARMLHMLHAMHAAARTRHARHMTRQAYAYHMDDMHRVVPCVHRSFVVFEFALGASSLSCMPRVILVGLDSG